MELQARKAFEYCKQSLMDHSNAPLRQDKNANRNPDNKYGSHEVLVGSRLLWDSSFGNEASGHSHHILKESDCVMPIS